MSAARVKVSLIVAADENDVIGNDGTLPWHIPADLKRFKALTIAHVVVSGRKTRDSIVARLGHDLPDRITVVVSRRANRRSWRRRPLVSDGQVIFQPDLPSALRVATAIEAFAGRTEVFVIGGAEIYAQVLPFVDRVYLTRVHDKVTGDASMPEGWLGPFGLTAEEAYHEAGFTWLTYERR